MNFTLEKIELRYELSNLDWERISFLISAIISETRYLAPGYTSSK